MTHADLHSFLSDTAGLGRTTMLFRENGLRTLLLHLQGRRTDSRTSKPGVR
jgi:hypothetical protein